MPRQKRSTKHGVITRTYLEMIGKTIFKKPEDYAMACIFASSMRVCASYPRGAILVHLDGQITVTLSCAERRTVRVGAGLVRWGFCDALRCESRHYHRHASRFIFISSPFRVPGSERRAFLCGLRYGDGQSLASLFVEAAEDAVWFTLPLGCIRPEPTPEDSLTMADSHALVIGSSESMRHSSERNGGDAKTSVIAVAPFW